MQDTLRENILKFDRAVPRYTSYPTAPHFQPKADWDISPYATLNPNDLLSLYIHVPFCAKMCWYCGCHTKVTRHYDPIEDYIDYVLREIALIELNIPHRAKVSHIHFGGGTPGILNDTDFSRVMSALYTAFDIQDGAEIAIEVDPRHVDEDKAIAYAKYGVNRISLGTQDFDQKVMESVNRPQTFEDNETAMILFRKHGIDNFNLDLMYGLPHQTVEGIKKTVTTALRLEPNRISLFGYAHVPWMKKHMRLIDEDTLPGKESRLDLFEAGAKILEDNGFVPIGIDHFAVTSDPMAQAVGTGALHRNFQGYTTDTATIMVGIGASSIGKTDEQYLQNYPDMPKYKAAIDANRLPIGKHCQISQRDTIRATIIERLMCDFTIDLADYDGDYTTELDKLNQLNDAGFITIDGTCITITRNARPMARLVCAVFDDYLPPETIDRHSKAV